MATTTSTRTEQELTTQQTLTPTKKTRGRPRNDEDPHYELDRTELVEEGWPKYTAMNKRIAKARADARKYEDKLLVARKLETDLVAEQASMLKERLEKEAAKAEKKAQKEAAKAAKKAEKEAKAAKKAAERAAAETEEARLALVAAVQQARNEGVPEDVVSATVSAAPTAANTGKKASNKNTKKWDEMVKLDDGSCVNPGLEVSGGWTITTYERKASASQGGPDKKVTYKHYRHSDGTMYRSLKQAKQRLTADHPPPLGFKA